MKNLINSLITLYKFIKTPKSDKEFVFFSESKFYRNHFKDIINELKIYKKNKIFFVCRDIEDYEYFKSQVNTIYLCNNNLLFIFFFSLKCKNLILTLTDLGVNFPKSKNCNNYIYFFHAFASTHKIYKKNAFKNYDIIFSNGNYQNLELKKAEEIYKFPKKIIENTGYFYFDFLKKNINFNLIEKNCILFAPSWNYNNKNLFEDFGFKIIEILLKENFSVILRPHSEHFKRSKNLIQNLTKHFEKDSFKIDDNLSNIHSMEKSELLISDNSSIFSEYLFAFKKPVIKIDYIDKIHNSTFEELNIETIDEKILKKFGNILNINHIQELPQTIKKITSSKLDEDEINKFIEKSFFNIGSSVKLAAKILKDKY